MMDQSNHSDDSGVYKLSVPTDDLMRRVDSFHHCTGAHTSTVPTWFELEEIERRRRAILKQWNSPFWRILAHWDGTCVQALMLDWMAWLSVLIYAAIRWQARNGEAGNMPQIAGDLGNSDIDILGGFLSFFLVLFVNHASSRFYEMYGFSKKVAGKIQDVAGLATTQLSSAAAHRLVRYMNAAHVAAYVGLGGPYSKRHFFDVVNQKYHLLNKQEMQRVREMGLADSSTGPATFKELVTWCQKDVGLARKAGAIDTYEANELHSRILEFRAAADGMYDYCDQPTHFFYVHFLCLLTVFYLPLFAIDNAYSAGWADESEFSNELLHGIIVLVQSIFVVGLRLLAQKLTDPYGEDYEDLSIMTYVISTIQNTRIILTAPDQPDVDSSLEEQLIKKNEHVRFSV